MLTAYRVAGHALTSGDGPDDESVWVDVASPDPAETALVEAAARPVDVPSQAEMAEIESSSRYYARDGVLYMNARVLRSSEEPPARLDDLAFILTSDRLVTVHHGPLRAVDIYAAAAMAGQRKCQRPVSIFVGIIEAVIDRLADILEHAAHVLEEVSGDVFVRVERSADPRPGLQPLPDAHPRRRRRCGQGSHEPHQPGTGAGLLLLRCRARRAQARQGGA